MSTLILRCFGPLEIRLGAAELEGFETRKARALLLYLACHAGQAFEREYLQSLLWSKSTPERSSRSLRQVLINLRRILPPDTLRITRQSIAFNPESDYELDVSRLMADPPAVEAYRGPFLQGFNLRNASRWEEWLHSQREELKVRALRGHESLGARYAAQGTWQPAMAHYLAALRIDPWRERNHRALMLTLARMGDRGAALAQYESCRAALEKGLGVAPSGETIALYERIQSATFPPPHNLPPQPTPFVGRNDELIHLQQLLAAADCRLLTLTGPGGIGKTRLALQTAAHHVTSFLHGVYFVPLAPVASVDLLLPTITESLSLPLSGRTDLKSQLFRFLENKEMLLVLDNFEHLTAGAGLLGEMLHQALGVKALVTSREPLNLRWEWQFPVEGLPVPEAVIPPKVGQRGEAETVKEAADDSAVQLFTRIARRVEPRFSLDADREAVAQICRLVEGSPLGIELAAVWVGTLPCARIARKIAHSLDLLATGMKDVPARHRSMRATFDYSWAMLTPRERLALRKLAVFQGSFSKEGARQVAGVSGPTLSSLAAKSLLGKTADGRFQWHELLRQYAQEKLAAQPAETGIVEEKHGQYYADFLADREPHLAGERQKEALDEIRAEIDNIRAGWARAIERGREEIIGWFLESLHHFYDWQSWFQEGEAAFGRAAVSLQLPSSEEGDSHSTPESRSSEFLLAKLLARQGKFCIRLSDYEKARLLLEKSLEISTRSDARQEMAFSLNALGIIAESRDYEEAQKRYEQSLEIYATLNDQAGMVSPLTNLGELVQRMGQLPEAKQYFQRALALARQAGNLWGVGLLLNDLGVVAWKSGNLEPAQQLLAESLELRQKIRDRKGIAYSHLYLGNVSEAQGRQLKATNHYRESIAIFLEIRDKRSAILPLSGLGHLACVSGEFEQAWDHFDEVLRFSRDLGFPHMAADVLVEIATLRAEEGDIEQAVELSACMNAHPLVETHIKRKSQILLQELSGQLPPDALSAAITRGEGRALEDVVDALTRGTERNS